MIDTLDTSKAIHSMDPPEKWFGFTYFSHMIPPVKMPNILILGYGAGTVAQLIRKVWGDWPSIDGVDLIVKHKADERNLFWETDAREFLKSAMLYDYVCIDLWNDESVCDFIYDLDFAKKIRAIGTNLVCMNIPQKDIEDKALVYFEAGLKYVRHDICYGNAIVWWTIKPD